MASEDPPKSDSESRSDAVVSPTDKGILRLAGPLIVSFWLRAAFGLVDTVYASELGEESDSALAAIALAMPFEFLMIACWVGTSNGLTARLAAAMGARAGCKIEQLKRATMRILIALIAVFVSLAGIAVWIADLYAPDAITARQFRIYAGVMLAGSAMTGFWSILPDSIVKAHQDTRSTMWAGLISATGNVVFNTIFVFVFHWGIFGIALSTVIGRLGGLVYAIRRARVHEVRRKQAGRDTVNETYDRPVHAILQIAVPAGLTFSLMFVESLAVNGILRNGPDPTSTLAAWGVFDRGVRFMAMPIIAVSAAMLPFAARLWGSRDVVGIRSGLSQSMLASLGFALVFVAPLAAVLGPWVAKALSDSATTQAAMQTGLYFVPFAVLAMAPMFVMRSAFDGMQHPRPGLVVGFLRSVLFVVPLTWSGLLVAEEFDWMPMVGACTGYVIGVGLASGILGMWLRSFLRQALPATGATSGSE